MKIAMLLSGGVDSSVALAFLKQQGHDVTAYYLKIWLEDEMSYMGNCPWEEDLRYASQVCKLLDVELRVVPFQKEYHERVVSYTIDSVKNGFTPNPDMLCNREVKFGAFLDKYGDEYDKVATGHYAQIYENKEGNFYLKCAPDLIKDQTYFLAMLKSEQLKKALFPIGHLEKKEVRDFAIKFNLPTAKRKDSQGICFLGKISFTDFIRHHLGEKKGEFVEKETGKVLGEHSGAYFFTIGQRKGIGLGGGPWYVCKKDIKNNIVYLSHGFGGDDQRLNAFSVANLNLMPQNAKISQKDIFEKKNLEVKLRHGPVRIACKAFLKENNEIFIKLSEKVNGLTPGQFAVFYADDLCLGGSTIKDTFEL